MSRKHTATESSATERKAKHVRKSQDTPEQQQKQVENTSTSPPAVQETQSSPPPSTSNSTIHTSTDPTQPALPAKPTKPKKTKQPKPQTSGTTATLDPTPPIPTTTTTDSDKASAPFTQWYMQTITAQYANDLDKLRSAADFKGDSSVAVLVQALRQGVEVFPENERWV